MLEFSELSVFWIGVGIGAGVLIVAGILEIGERLWERRLTRVYGRRRDWL